MLETLKFCMGAVAKKDYVPALTHFRIDGGKILGFNGAIALCSKIDLNLTCSPKALSFVKAIQRCQETVQLHLAPNGKLAVKSGRFSAYVDCLPEGQNNFPDVAPEGEDLHIDGQLLIDCFKVLSPFIAEDASRAWARGILFRKQSAFATNNVIIIERWLGVDVPEINIPAETVAELARIGVPPTRVQSTSRSITFHYEDGRWLRSQLLTTEWPDVSRILDTDPGTQIAIPDDFFKGLEDLLPFIGELEACHFHEGKISTDLTEGSGAQFEIQGLPSKGCWNLKQLQELKRVVETIDFGLYPSHVMFFGERIRGCIAGIRV